MASAAGPSSSSRAELIHNAVLFLSDPKVSQSTLTAKIEFLQSKGLSEAEIQQAFAQASSNNGSSGPSHQPPIGYNYGYNTDYALRAPEPPRRDWRDIFIMAIVSGGVVYGLSTLARKYLLPHLEPPSSTSFQQTSQALEEKYDEAFRLLDSLSGKTTELQDALDGDRARLQGVVDSVENAVRGVSDAEKAWRDDLREIRGEVEGVREMVPKMIDKHAQQQSAALSDLQSELRSLKALITSKLAAPPDAASPVGKGKGKEGEMSSTMAAANALLQPGRRGIPAWQRSASPSAPSSEAEGTTPEGSLAGSAVLEKE